MALSVPAPTRRVLAAASAALLALLTVFAVVASPAQAAPRTTDDPAAAAAGWLARQFVDGTTSRPPSMARASRMPGSPSTRCSASRRRASPAAAPTPRWPGSASRRTWSVRRATAPPSRTPGAGQALAHRAGAGLGPDRVRDGRVDLLARLRALITPSGRFSDKSCSGLQQRLLPVVRDADAGSGRRCRRAGGVVPGRVRLPETAVPADFGERPARPTRTRRRWRRRRWPPRVTDPAAAAGMRWPGRRPAAAGRPFGGGTSTEVPTRTAPGWPARRWPRRDRPRRRVGRRPTSQPPVRAAPAPAAQRGAIAFDGRGSTRPSRRGRPRRHCSGCPVRPADARRHRAEPAAPGAGLRGAAAQLGPGHAVPRRGRRPPRRPPRAPTSQAAAPVPTPSTSPAAFGGTLPNTGASPLPVVWIGLGLLAGGTALAFLGRRRRPAMTVTAGRPRSRRRPRPGPGPSGGPGRVGRAGAESAPAGPVAGGAGAAAGAGGRARGRWAGAGGRSRGLCRLDRGHRGGRLRLARRRRAGRLRGRRPGQRPAALSGAGHGYTFVPRQPGLVCQIDAGRTPATARRPRRTGRTGTPPGAVVELQHARRRVTTPRRHGRGLGVRCRPPAGDRAAGRRPAPPPPAPKPTTKPAPRPTARPPAVRRRAGAPGAGAPGRRPEAAHRARRRAGARRPASPGRPPPGTVHIGRSDRDGRHLHVLDRRGRGFVQLGQSDPDARRLRVLDRRARRTVASGAPAHRSWWPRPAPLLLEEDRRVRPRARADHRCRRDRLLIARRRRADPPI